MAQGGKSLEVRAGLVVLVGIIVLAAGMYYVSGGGEMLTDKKIYTILFKDGGGIAGGDTVRLAGRRIGDVKWVEENNELIVDPKTGKQARAAVAVKIEVFAETQIPEDSEFFVYQTITGIRSFEIKKGDAQTMVTPESKLAGRKLETFEELLDRTAGTVKRADDFIKHLDESLTKVDENIIEKIDVETIQNKVNDFLDSLNRSAAKVETKLDGWSEDIDVVLGNTKNATKNAEDFTASLKDDWPGMKEKIDSTLESADSGMKNFDGILAENREPIKEMIDNLKSASGMVGPTIIKVQELAADLQDTVTEIRPDLAGTLKSARRAMDNFKAATEDLKTAPWKLVRGVSKDESNQVHLYNAAKMYVDAAGEIRILVDDLDTLRRLGVLDDPAKAELVDKVHEDLRKALSEFQAAESKLANVLEKGIEK